MQGEADPFIKALGLSEHDTPALAPFRHFARGDTHLVTAGRDARFSCASVGGEIDQVGLAPAAALAFAAISHLNPRQVINFGTAGGFQELGSEIASVYLSGHFRYHDRQIPISPAWEAYGVGDYRFAIPEALKEFPQAIVSSGNALSIEPHQQASMLEIGKASGLPVVKDMEGAAIAQVCQMKSVPLLSIKSVTDLIDGGRHTQEEFLENFGRATGALKRAVAKVNNRLRS